MVLYILLYQYLKLVIKPSGKLLLCIITYIIIRDASDDKLTGFCNLSIHKEILIIMKIRFEYTIVDKK